jgi:hypothetical protein
MRSSTSALHSRVPARRLSYVNIDATDSDSRQAWRSRALYEAATVRRALRAEGSNATGVSTPAMTIEALECGAVAELLVTPRYIDVHPEDSTKAMRLGRACGARLSVLSGSAAFELDLVAGGIGAILRRSSSPCAVDAHTA